jgi:hypothetical protein
MRAVTISGRWFYWPLCQLVTNWNWSRQSDGQFPSSCFSGTAHHQATWVGSSAALRSPIFLRAKAQAAATFDNKLCSVLIVHLAYVPWGTRVVDGTNVRCAGAVDTDGSVGHGAGEPTHICRCSRALLDEKERAPVLVLLPQGNLVQLTHGLVHTHDNLQALVPLRPVPTAVPHLPSSCADKSVKWSSVIYSRMMDAWLIAWLPCQHLTVGTVDLRQHIWNASSWFSSELNRQQTAELLCSACPEAYPLEWLGPGRY